MSSASKLREKILKMLAVILVKETIQKRFAKRAQKDYFTRLGLNEHW